MIAEAQGPVSVPVHAPSSGTVTAIEARAVPHASGLTDTCIEISLDGKDAWVDCEGLDNWRDEPKPHYWNVYALPGSQVWAGQVSPPR